MVACDSMSELARVLARHWMRGRGRFPLALRRNQPFQHQPDSLGNTLKTFNEPVPPHVSRTGTVNPRGQLRVITTGSGHEQHSNVSPSLVARSARPLCPSSSVLSSTLKATAGCGRPRPTTPASRCRAGSSGLIGFRCGAPAERSPYSLLRYLGFHACKSRNRAPPGP